jgi:hypothetical protein
MVSLVSDVDAYTSHPLRGCVNDVDAVQRLLLGPRMGLAPAQIRRLASPHPDAHHDTSVPSEPATLANLRHELQGLAEGVERTDRVFIYYAGHGTRDEFTADGRRFHCEALVPADWDPDASDPRLLYDFELNTWLRAIVARTRSVAMVMDCCHAAGATRDFLDPGDWEPRFLGVPRSHGSRSEPPPVRGALPTSAGPPERLAASVEDCQVISACLAHERAQEGRGAGDIRRGLFTHAWLAALDDVPTNVDLTAVTWGRIWQRLCAGVQQRNPGQHASLIGHPGRAVFGGPPAEGDTGIPVSLREERYRVEIGTLAGVTKGAKLAVYGAEPVFFPRLGSMDDLGARVGVLRVIEEGLATATATAEGSSFKLPPDARARLIEPGQNERLRFAVVPRDADLEERLASAPLLELVADPVQADVRLERGDGRWFVTDGIHGTGRATVPGANRGDDTPVLFALQTAELDCARDVLEHYYLYSRPLRVAGRARDLPGSLALRVLHCPQGALSSAEAQAGALPEARSRAERSYQVPSGSLVCFAATNQSLHRLRVTLLNSAASGKVQLLGDEIIEPGAQHVFWAGGALGSPFQMTPPRGLERCIDRLVAIGRTSVGHDLSYLRVDRSFAEIVQRSRSASRAAGDRRERDSVLEHWTASEVVIETRRDLDRP